MVYRLVWSLVRFLCVVLLRRRDHGSSRVPPSGPVLLAGNHISNLDPPVIATGIWRPCRFMAKEELFSNRWFGGFIRLLGAFPVKRGSGDRAALKAALECLERGEALVMFPEGTRSEDGELQEPEMGIGMIAYRSGAPIVPVYIHGTNRVMPKNGGIRLSPIGVRYGEPLSFRVAEGEKPGRAEYEAAAREVMAAIAALRDEHRSSR